MEKAKQFIKDHKKELIISGGLIFAYKLGFYRGCKATDKAVTAFVNKLIEIVQIEHF